MDSEGLAILFVGTALLWLALNLRERLREPLTDDQKRAFGKDLPPHLRSEAPPIDLPKWPQDPARWCDGCRANRYHNPEEKESTAPATPWDGQDR